MGNIYKQTTLRIERIKKMMPDFNVIEIWECDFDKLCLQEPTLKSFLTINKIVEPLKPREALFGGRTNAFTLYYKCKDNEQIHYKDFTSLYPAVQKQEKYPIGHPIILDNSPVYAYKKYFGLIKCLILPPRGIYFPVLPARFNSKLVLRYVQHVLQLNKKTFVDIQ
jgi:hypothetical protein